MDSPLAPGPDVLLDASWYADLQIQEVLSESWYTQQGLVSGSSAIDVPTREMSRQMKHCVLP